MGVNTNTKYVYGVIGNEEVTGSNQVDGTIY